MPTCLVERCERAAKSRGWCNAHYERWRKHGDPLYGGPTLARRGGGTTTSRGYKAIYVNGDKALEHRKVAEKHLGRPLLPEEVIHHEGAKDDNRWEMLKVFPNQAAHNRHHAKQSTQCRHGHKRTEENTQIDSQGRRRCRICRQETQQSFRARNPGYQKSYRASIAAQNQIATP